METVKTYLVTGSAGFGGRALVAALNAVGHRVVQYDMASRPADDIRDTERLLGILNSEEIDTVFHLAAQPIVPESLRDPVRTWSINADGTISVLEAMRRSRATKRLIFASSGAFYGTTSTNEAIPETAPPLPAGNPYSASKQAADLAVQSWAPVFGLKAVICRFMNTYGRGDLHTSRLIPGALAKLEGDEPFDFGDRDDGTTKLDFLHISDMTRGYLAAADHLVRLDEACTIFNFGTGNPISLRDVVVECSRAFDGKAREPIFRGPTPEGGPRSKSLDIRKAASLLSWKPEIETQRGIRELF